MICVLNFFDISTDYRSALPLGLPRIENRRSQIRASGGLETLRIPKTTNIRSTREN